MDFPLRLLPPTARIGVIFAGASLLLFSADRSTAALSQLDFAKQEISTAVVAVKAEPLEIDFVVDATMGPQAYRFQPGAKRRLRIVAGDETGAMYGALDVAESVRLGTVEQLGDGVHAPHILRRGIKFNVPLDLRTPSYSDCSDAAQANIPEMWKLEFWTAFLDEMARHRYNVLSLWSLHPFPSLVKVPEFPDIALNDVWRTRVKLDDSFHSWGIDMVRPAMLADHEVVTHLTIEDKIAFWREVMRYAKARGIEVFVVTWNVFTWGTEGKYGITNALDNPTTVAYTRASVRELILTYPLLAGIGITAGENMVLEGADADAVREKWLWSTYGEGIRDALKKEPARKITLIHRFHMASRAAILEEWKDYPGPFEFSFKYSVAHMYSIANPPFLHPLLSSLGPKLKTWLTVRNDDLYSFRFGDPDYIRDYIMNMPSAEKLAGFYMGPDGYTWGRDFLDRTPAAAGPALIIEKQWYAFMLMGRLGYDPTLSNAHFERVIAARFPGADAPAIYAALQAASETMPLITRFFWGDIDLKWFPEACLSHPQYHGFYTVRDFVAGKTMPGSGVLNVQTWVNQRLAAQPMNGTTPLQIADSLDAAATRAMASVAAVRAANAPAAASELDKTLADCDALAWLARYYATKIRAACALGMFDRTVEPSEQRAAVSQLQRALGHWQQYAAVRDARYRPALYNRVGFVDITALTKNVAADIRLAESWRRGDQPPVTP